MVKTIQSIENCLLAELKNDDLKNQICGLLSNVESSSGLVDKHIAVSEFNSYILALRDVKAITVDVYDYAYMPNVLGV